MAFKRIRVWQKLAGATALLGFAGLLAWGVMLKGLDELYDALEMANNDRQVAQSIGDVNYRITAGELLIAKAQAEPQRGRELAGQLGEQIELAKVNLELIAKSDLQGDEKAANDAYYQTHGKFVSQILEPALVAMQRGDAAALARLATGSEALMLEARKRIADIQAAVSQEEAEAASVAYTATRWQSQIGLIVGLLISAVVVALVLRSTVRRMGYIRDKLLQVSEGNYFDWVEIDADDEIGQMLRSLKSVQISLGFEVMDAREKAASSARIQQALDNVTASVMVADASNNIIYLNPSVSELFRNAQEAIREDLPGFDASSLIGQNIDQFHKNPAHQRGLLETLSKRHEAGFVIGGRTMRFIANPVRDANGERLGTVVEWQDRTEEVAIENELGELVSAARDGDLSQRAQTEGRKGFLLNMSEGINSVFDVVGEVFDDVNQVMSAMAAGDLTRNMSGEYNGIYAEVQSNVNDTIQNLERTVSQISDAADVISTGASEIVSGNNNLSARTEQQASSLEETASSMEELTSTVKTNADNAQQANQLALGARQTAEKGGDVVSHAVTAMSEISQSSEKIAEIIGVIDEIAFQTNLLALNASVEAARAGEQGRGFAVVATEVRNLAQRSATAAKEIKDLIQDSVGKVKAGSELVNASGETLEEIVVGVKRVGDIISEIAAASAEQSAGIEQVNKAVTSMDEVTQQNAALAEETSAASVSMNEKADQMMQLVGYFKLSRGAASMGGSAYASPAQSAPAAAYKPAPAMRQGTVSAAPKAAAKSPLAKPSAKPAPQRAAPPAAADDDEWEEF